MNKDRLMRERRGKRAGKRIEDEREEDKDGKERVNLVGRVVA